MIVRVVCLKKGHGFKIKWNVFQFDPEVKTYCLIVFGMSCLLQDEDKTVLPVKQLTKMTKGPVLETGSVRP